MISQIKVRQSGVKWYQSVFSGVTWISALGSVDGEVPSHAAECAVGQSHVPVPCHSQPRVIPLFGDGALLPTTTGHLSH